MKRVRLIISGGVQGVLFRYTAKRVANSLGLKGFVKNLPNGDVEVVAEGNEEKIEELVRFCRKGPALAHVSDVKVCEEKYTGEFEGFEVRY